MLEKAGRRIRLEQQTFAWNRYKEGLAFSVNLLIERNTSRLSTDWWDAERRNGPIIFLPKISVSEDETLAVVLRDICGVEAGIPEPEWIATYEVPGQDQIDNQIADIRSRIAGARNELSSALEKRANAREYLKLLYERGQPLEIAVRTVLRALGASVEDPKGTEKEDGRITVAVGANTYEGVLEAKSTKNEDFDEYGLKQLLEWTYRGV